MPKNLDTLQLGLWRVLLLMLEVYFSLKNGVDKNSTSKFGNMDGSSQTA